MKVQEEGREKDQPAGWRWAKGSFPGSFGVAVRSGARQMDEAQACQPWIWGCSQNFSGAELAALQVCVAATALAPSALPLGGVDKKSCAHTSKAC